jgi:sulfite reductase (NADPH) flavoprotein alpha-component
MIGPGTGIAPYRSFLAERDALGAAGKNWLFFGEQHFTTDFLYQTELQNWFETGVLTKISLAFSRDQPEKIYVQHRMFEQGAELYNWIQSGAHVYLCGKKDPMSVDVEHTLVEIIQKYGEKTTEEAKEYFLQMQNEGRYSEDVY